MLTARTAILLFSTVLLHGSALAASSDVDVDVLPGFQRFHAADDDGARRHFDGILAAHPQDLGARFGLVVLQQRRIVDHRDEMPAFERALDALIADAERRYNRAQTDSQALFYAANAYMLRARYRVAYDKGMWGAGRDGAKAKRLIETYVRRHPDDGDAYFALGAYNYYVELAPTFFKVIRTFLFLPSGNREEGLRQLERAYREGQMLGPLGGMLLIEIYSQFESRPADGLRVGERLAGQFPDNAQVRFALAELYLSPAVEDAARAEEQYAAVLAREERRAGPARPARYRAHLGLAAARTARWHMDEAIAEVTRVIDAAPAQPAWVMPNALLRRGNYRALLDDPRADADARRVLAEPGWKDRHKGASDQIAWIERRRTSGEAAVYAALVPGNRLTAERRWDEAGAAYEQVRARHPEQPQVRFRIAQLRFRRGDTAAPARDFGALANAKTHPDWLRAQALLYLGRTHDLAGRRAEAQKAYQQVVDNYERESAAWPARVGLITPYQRQRP